MKLWMRKIVVALITVATLGIYTPTALLEVDAEEAKDRLTKSDVNEATTSSEIQIHHEEPTDLHPNPLVDQKDSFIQEMTNQAKEQMVMKFGPRIMDQVEDEFTESIFPTIEFVLASIIEDAGDDYIHYEITEEPTKGYGERIFHVYNHKKEEDVARFHVRRVNRPLDGYYFNFHYHLSRDGFKEHHDLGEIYWDKNTPPKWMS